MTRRNQALFAFAAAALTTLSAQAVQRTFVASYGNDANTATNCGFANPCRGFTAAQTVTDPNGEIVALDAAGYGAIAITKSITITANSGFYAGISASTGNAVTIATAGVSVILRGLNLNGIGATNGVSMTNGNALVIDNCLISGFSGSGVTVLAPARVRVNNSTVQRSGEGVQLDGGVTATVTNSRILDNSDRGIWVYANTGASANALAVSDTVITGSFVAVQSTAQVSGASAKVSVTRATIAGNSYGPAVFSGSGGSAVLSISDSMIANNLTAFYQDTGTLETLGNNNFRGNGAPAGSLTPVALN